MPDLICNTSPLQYLHQLELVRALRTLAATVVVPPAVVHELAVGRSLGLNVPDVAVFTWITTRRPASFAALPLVTDLGPGETEVLALGLESPESVVVIDDAAARRVAETLKLRLTGTLGILLDAKRAGLVSSIRPLLDQLDALGFRLAAHTRAAVLERAGELPDK